MRKQISHHLSLDLSLEETPSQLNSMKESLILNRTLSYRNLPIAQTVIETAGLWNFHTIDDCLLLLNSHICSRTTEDNHEAIICVAWMPMKRTFLLLHPLVTSTFRLSTLLPSRSAENQFWVFSAPLDSHSVHAPEISAKEVWGESKIRLVMESYRHIKKVSAALNSVYLLCLKLCKAFGVDLIAFAFLGVIIKCWIWSKLKCRTSS